ncbi:general stress protein [Sporosarcina sp. USHLN248]|uniref:general stress protein n=1 Tax=Sporosarcina sp. USHLN248 TaxID=3081300 RepID=UPI00301B5DBA
MEQKTFVGLYDTEQSIIDAIEKLEEKGIDPSSMYIVAKNEEDVDLFRRKSFHDIQSAPSNYLDRIISFFSGENHVRSMLVEIGLDEADLKKYESEIKQGKWLLYVEGEPEKTVYEILEERNKPETNPFNRPVSEAAYLQQNHDLSSNIGDDGMPKNDFRDSIVPDTYEMPFDQNRALGRIGAETLFDKTEYEPKNSNQHITPNNIQSSTDEERKRLHMRYKQERMKRHEEEQSGLPHPTTFMESQTERQDAIEEFDPEETSTHFPMPKNTDGENVNTVHEPIIIDLRNIHKASNNPHSYCTNDHSSEKKK